MLTYSLNGLILSLCLQIEGLFYCIGFCATCMFQCMYMYLVTRITTQVLLISSANHAITSEVISTCLHTDSTASIRSLCFFITSMQHYVTAAAVASTARALQLLLLLLLVLGGMVTSSPTARCSAPHVFVFGAIAWGAVGFGAVGLAHLVAFSLCRCLHCKFKTQDKPSRC